MHDVIVVGVPLLAILAGILISRNGIRELRAEMNAGFNQVNDRFNKIESRLAGIEADLRHFFHIAGKLEGRVDALQKRL